MKEIMPYIPFLIPYLILEFGLAITALIHVIKHSEFRFGNKALWIIIVLFFQILGPICYFVFGKGEE